MAIRIEKAQSTDTEAVITLLEQGHLLIDDLPTDLANFLIAKEQNALIGVAGLECFGSTGLLRSVAVDPQYQGNRVAAELISRLLEMAKAENLGDIYLITTSASRYFEKHGFQAVNRQDVPVPIQQTRQFSNLCPSSAIVMKRPVSLNQKDR